VRERKKVKKRGETFPRHTDAETPHKADGRGGEEKEGKIEFLKKRKISLIETGGENFKVRLPPVQKKGGVKTYRRE